jgi:hypothetical protein
VNVKAIPIELIRLDGGTQIRACSTFQTKVEDYAIAMTQDADFPPLTVFWDGADYWLADGFHRHGAYNFIMQTLGLPGMNLPCEVLEGTQRDAILYACSANSAHGMPRTVPDKQNAVRTMLKNPLVALNEDGVPWTDRQIGRICNVDHKMVGRHRADLAAEAAKSQNSDNGHLGHAPDSGQRAVTRGGTTYTMNTTNIGTNTAPSEAKTPIVVVEPAKVEPAKPEPAPLPEAPATKPGGLGAEPEPEAPAKTAEVVQFTSPHDYLYDLLSQIDRAMKALPEPYVVAFELPVAHRPELVPTGPEQRRHLPPPGNGFGRTAPMFQSVLVAWLAADPINAAVEPTAGSPRHSR